MRRWRRNGGAGGTGGGGAGSVNGAGGDATGYGSGGGGGAWDGSYYAGGNGSPGVVIISFPASLSFSYTGSYTAGGGRGREHGLDAHHVRHPDLRRTHRHTRLLPAEMRDHDQRHAGRRDGHLCHVLQRQR